MARKTDDSLTWHEISTDHDGADLRKARDAFVKANEVAKKAREAYDAKVRAALIDSKLVMDAPELEILIGHRFGKLSYATRKAAPKAAASNSKAVKL